MISIMIKEAAFPSMKFVWTLIVIIIIIIIIIVVVIIIIIIIIGVGITCMMQSRAYAHPSL